MDPVSVAASVAGIISLGIQVAQSLIDFYQSTKCDVAGTLEKLGHLLSILESLRKQLDNRKFRIDEQELLKQIEGLVEGCDECIKELHSQFKRCKDEHLNGIRTITRTISRRLAFYLRQSTLQKIEEDVDEIVSHLSLALQILQQKGIDRVQYDIESLLDLFKADQTLTTFHKWLKAPDVTINYNEAAKKRQPGTGLWFVQGVPFHDWLANPNSFLWLNGFAGCGKSALCSTVIEHIFRYKKSNSHIRVGIAVFFFRFNDDTKQDASAMIRSLICQLSFQVDDKNGLDLRSVGDYPQNSTPPNHVLVDILRRLVHQFKDVYIILDALDESPRGKLRQEVLQTIVDAREWSEPGLHVLVSSRDETDIHDELGSPGDNIISMKNSFVDQDIATFVANHLRANRRLRKWEAHYDQIEAALIDGAKGVFRWAECQFAALEACPGSKRRLDLLLASLPRSLDKTYERMLESIDVESVEDAQRILALLCCAKRPLTVPELIDAVAVELGDSLAFNLDGRLFDEDEIRRICPGLLEVDVQPSGKPSTVRIAHYSIQEYLESNRICERKVANFSIRRPETNTQIASICLTYLLMPPVSAEETILEDRPFSFYAAQSWYAHYRDGNKEGHGIERQILRFFQDCKGAFNNWVTTWNVDVYDGRRPSGTIQTPVYYASLLGLDSVLSSLLDGEQSWDSVSIKTQAGTCGNALQAASSGGHEKIVRILLGKAAPVDMQGGIFGNALQAACAGGHRGVVELLLENSADVNLRGGRYGNALQAASARGNEAIVKLLLDSGAEVNAQAGWYDTALQAASARGHEGVVQILLEAGADVSKAGGKYGSALKAASHGGYGDIAQKLKEKGATLTIGDRKSTTLVTRSKEDAYSFFEQYLESLCRRRNWRDPLYECFRDCNGYTCLVLVNGREYQTDLSYESESLARNNAAMRAFMVCQNFSVNGGMLARNGIVQGLPADDSNRRHRRGRRSGSRRNPRVFRDIKYE